MLLFRPSKKEEKATNITNAMLIGTRLDTLPLVARNRVMKIAATLGWQPARFAERTMVGLLAKALHLTRERLQSEQKTIGLDEIDRLWHYWTYHMRSK
jgi:hypothetical protein